MGRAADPRARRPPRLADRRRRRCASTSTTCWPSPTRSATRASTDVVLLGMGGSSLAPEVIRQSFGEQEGWPSLHVLDSTDAGAVARGARRRRPRPHAVPRLDEVRRDDRDAVAVRATSGRCAPTARRFVAITDPGSGLQRLADEHGFRRTFLNDPEIGGRYSALSYFGLVPAALMGADVAGLLDRAGVAEQSCLTFDSSNTNSGLWLGLAWGELAAAGPRQADLRRRRAARELRPVGRAAHRRVDGQARQGHPARRRRAARRAGRLRRRPHVPLPAPRRRPARRARRAAWRRSPRRPPGRSRAIDGPEDLGRIFFVAEFAIAVAGWVLGINPFDQPNVQEAKDATARVLDEGAEDQPDADDDALRALLADLEAPGYLAILGYVAPSADVRRGGRRAARGRSATPRRAATTFGYGPRYLHSTGQLHKGGPAARPLPGARPRLRPRTSRSRRPATRSPASSTPRRSATSRRCAATTGPPSA